MDKLSMLYRKTFILVAVIALGIATTSQLQYATADSVFDDGIAGHTYELTVTNCDGEISNDVICFEERSMSVESLSCNSGTFIDLGTVFIGAVDRVIFIGTLKSGRLVGSSIAGSCKSAFIGKQVDTCPCASDGSNSADREPNPYER